MGEFEVNINRREAMADEILCPLYLDQPHSDPIQASLGLPWELLNYLPHGFFVKSLPKEGQASRYWAANQAMANFFGSPSMDAMIGKTDAELGPAPLAASIAKLDLEAVATHRPVVNRELCRVTPDGAEQRFVLDEAPWLSATGHIIGLVGVLRAAGKPERPDRPEQPTELALLMEATANAVAIIDLEGRIGHWNKAAEQLYGWSAWEALGRPASEILGQDKAEFKRAWNIVLAHQEWSGTLAARDRENRELSVNAKWSLAFSAQGHPQSILMVFADSREQKTPAAHQLLRTQRLEGIGMLASGIAHDLNNILAPMMMAGALLRDKIKDPEGRWIIETMEANAARGAGLVKQILSFARGAQGESLRVDLSHLAREMMKTIAETFPKSIVAKLDYAPGPWHVRGDPVQLHQVLLNLCLNARDAMPAGGKLAISIETATLDECFAAMNPEIQPGLYVMLKIADTGEGIPGAIMDKIFQPFFTTKPVGQGTGLGLATVRAIVKNHHGVVHVESEPGKGSTFKIYLPADSESASSRTVAARDNLPRGNHECVLLADDEPSIREVTRKTLERYGYRVLTAANGAEAVTLYETHQATISIVLADMVMPVMNGQATIAALKTINPRVKVIAISGLGSGLPEADAAEIGVTHYLRKPYTAEMLLRLLAQMLRSGELAPPFPKDTSK